LFLRHLFSVLKSLRLSLLTSSKFQKGCAFRRSNQYWWSTKRYISQSSLGLKRGLTNRLSTQTDSSTTLTARCALRHSHRKTSFGTLHRHTECYTGTAQHPCKTKRTAKVLTIVQAQKANLETYSKRSAAEAFKANLPQTAPFKIPSQTCLSLGFIYFHRTVALAQNFGKF
jgi:hypothetical protein